LRRYIVRIHFRIIRTKKAGKKSRGREYWRNEIYTVIKYLLLGFRATIEYRIRGGSEWGRGITNRNKESFEQYRGVGVSYFYLFPTARAFPDIQYEGVGNAVKIHDISSDVTPEIYMNAQPVRRNKTGKWDAALQFTYFPNALSAPFYA